MTRPREYRDIKDVLPELNLQRSRYESPEQELTKETRKFIHDINNRPRGQIGRPFKEAPVALATKFLREKEMNYFGPGFSNDARRSHAISLIAEIMGRQSIHDKETGVKPDKARGKTPSSDRERFEATENTPRNMYSNSQIPKRERMPLYPDDSEEAENLSENAREHHASNVQLSNAPGPPSNIRSSGQERVAQGNASVETDPIPLRQHDNQQSSSQQPSRNVASQTTVPTTTARNREGGAPEQVHAIPVEAMDDENNIRSERTDEDIEVQTFTVTWGLGTYQLPGVPCAEILGETMARLAMLGAGSRLAKGSSRDYPSEVVDLFNEMAARVRRVIA